MTEFESILISPNGIIQVSPLGIESLVRTGELDVDPFFFKKYNLTGKLTFVKSDFAHLYEWEKSDQRSEKASLVINQLTPSGKKELLRYVLCPDDITWDVDKCNCIVEINKPDHYYDKYNEIKDIKYNIYDLCPHSLTWYDRWPNSPGREIPNGVILHDALEAILRKGYPGMKVKSHFFGWYDTQSYTVGHSAMLTKLILSHNSDIYDAYTAKPGGASAPATILEITLSEFLDTFCYLLNLKCDIENMGVFRIEHYNYWETVSGITADATIGDNYLYNFGKLYKYEHNNNNRYSKEDFQPIINADGGDPAFMPTAIIYETNNSQSVNVLTKSANFTTQIKYGADFAPGLDIKRGYFLGALDPATNTLQHVTVTIGVPGAPYLPATMTYGGVGNYNQMLGWPICMLDYHRSGKSYNKFKILDPQLPFPQSLPGYSGYIPLTTQARRFVVQKGIKLKDCYNELDILNGTVLTGLGSGRVMKTTKKLGDTYLEADVYFYDDESNVITTPTAIDDSYNATVNTTLNTSALALNPLLYNDTPAGTACYVETKPTLNGGTVIIASTGHFVYTPANNFEGYDYFDYHIINSSGKISTATCSINVS